jgi:hypothetical protein
MDLVNQKIEGSGKYARHVKIRSLNEHSAGALK